MFSLQIFSFPIFKVCWICFLLIFGKVKAIKTKTIGLLDKINFIIANLSPERTIKIFHRSSHHENYLKKKRMVVTIVIRLGRCWYSYPMSVVSDIFSVKIFVCNNFCNVSKLKLFNTNRSMRISIKKFYITFK